MLRVCAHCGTEVDPEALFCPTCGQPTEPGAEPPIPPAPDWPDFPARPIPPAEPEDDAAAVMPAPAEPPAPEPEPAVQFEPVADPEPAPGPGERESQPAAAQPADEPVSALPPEDVVAPPAPSTHAWERPADEAAVPPWRRGAIQRAAADENDDQAAAAVSTSPPPPAGGAGASQATSSPGGEGAAPGTPEGVLTVPTLLSDWLAGIGALVALVAVFLPWSASGFYTSGWGLSSGINVLFLVVLLAVLAVVFLPSLLPPIPQRPLILLSVGLVGVGIGLDRLGLPVTGMGGSVFLIASLAMAGGGALAQLGHDRPVGGPQA